MDEEPDDIFRYPIEAQESRSNRDPLVKLRRLQLESLPKLLSFCHKGEEVKVDGFRPISERQGIHPVHQWEKGTIESSPHATEPPLPKREENSTFRSDIKRVAESLLSLVGLEYNAEPGKIDGLGLKKINHWLVPSAGEPTNVFDHPATRCNRHYSPHYLRGSPPLLGKNRSP